MVAPLIEFWNSTDTAKYASLPYGNADTGADSSVITLDIWNDKGDVLHSADATTCTITTVTTSGALTGLDVVTGKWYNVECTSYGDAVYTAVGGATTKAIGPSAALETLAKNTKAVCLTKYTVPVGATTGLRTLKIRVAYSYI